MNNYNQLNDKIKGCLFGGAVGDALGYPVEFMSHSEIVSKYGDYGIQEYEFNFPGEKDKFREAQISDDTQMTLYTAEAILCDMMKPRFPIPDEIRKRFED